MIKYLNGNVLTQDYDKQVIIPHVCNDEGKWGAGFVLAINNLSLKPYIQYRASSREERLRLGDIQTVQINKNITIANMIGQKSCGSMRILIPKDKIVFIPPIRYDSLRECMYKVAVVAKHSESEIHAPMFGAGLAGGDWSKIEELINECWIENNIPVTVYKYQENA